jgi:hypothetical protein
VISADENGGGWTVAVQWDLPIKPPRLETEENKDQPFLAANGGKPLADWFSRSEYQQYLVEVEGEDTTVSRLQKTRELYLGEIGIDVYAVVEVVPGDAAGLPEEFRLIIKKPSGQLDVRLSQEDLS